MFEKIWKKILRRPRLSLLAVPAFLLWLVSFPYRMVVCLVRRSKSSRFKLDLPLISIGNISVGGTGKTPMVATLTQSLLTEGFRVGIVSSGYGREREVPLLLPGHQLLDRPVTEVGDELFDLAGRLPEAYFSIDRQKNVAARSLAQSGAVDVIIVDDGFQHFALARDIDIVTYDAALEPRVLKRFPYGVLREPLGAMRRADIIIITRVKFATDIGKLSQRLSAINPDASVYHAGFEIREIVGKDARQPVKYLEDKSVFLFAGVGNFRTLKQQVVALAGDVDYALELSDHQRYTRELLRRIRLLADKQGSDLILTTSKDWVKLGGFDFGREIYYLDLVTDLNPGEERLVAEVIGRLDLRKQDG